MPNELSNFITILLGLLITACVPTLTLVVYRFFDAKAKEVMARMTPVQLAQFRGLLQMAVIAAKQAGLAGLIENTGAAKKEEALTTLQAIVDANKWNIPLAQISAEVEAAIAIGLHNAQTLPDTITPLPVPAAAPAPGAVVVNVATPVAAPTPDVTAVAAMNFLKVNDLKAVPITPLSSPSSGYAPDAGTTVPPAGVVPASADDVTTAAGDTMQRAVAAQMAAQLATDTTAAKVAQPVLAPEGTVG